jgi:hypothetical protein
MSKLSTREIFVYKATEIYGDLYGYSLVEYVDSSTEVIIICKVHGEFLQKPINHLHVGGCRLCGIDKRSKGRRLSLETFINTSNIAHNYLYGYELVKYVNNHTAVTIICPIHGEFPQRPDHHMNGHGCIKCGGTYSPTNEEYIKEVELLHNYRYGYMFTQYIDSLTDIIITCPIHGNFIQNAKSHRDGKGCKKCAPTYSPTNEEYIKEALIVHNNKYDLSRVIYQGTWEFITIICPHHGEFDQRAGYHIRGSGCPRCIKTISNGEIEFLNYCNIPDDKLHRQVRINIPVSDKITWCFPDGYDDKTNTIYEYLGDYWHGNPDICRYQGINKIVGKSYKELYDHTFLKFKRLKNIGYNIKYIWENDWNRFKDGIDREPIILNY